MTIQTYTSSEQGEEAYLLLNDVQPTHVVLYDAEPSFIRSLKVHSACCCGSSSNNGCKSDSNDLKPLRVYFMLFEASAEEKNYLKSLQREQNALERLIQHKKSMPLPVKIVMCDTTRKTVGLERK